MAEDDALFVIVEFAEGDEAAALNGRILRAGNDKTLRIGEDAGFFFAREYALGSPIGKIARRPAVDAGAA